MVMCGKMNQGNEGKYWIFLSAKMLGSVIVVCAMERL